MSSSVFIESPIKTTANESHEPYEAESSTDQEINKNDFIKSGPSNLVVVYGSNGVQVDRDELEKLIADESNLSTISVIRLTSPTPSMKQEDDEEQKTKSKHLAKKKSNNNDNDSTLNENPNEDSNESSLSESNSIPSDDEYSDDDLLATLSGAEKNKKHKKKVVEKSESAGLIIEGFYPPDQAKILAKEILNISGINRLTFKLDKKFQELQLLALSNDHCYTPLLSPTQEPIIEKIPDNKKVPIQPPEKIQQKLINLKQSAIAKQRSSSNDSTNKLDTKHKNSTDELTGDNESDSDEQSDEESESVDTDNDRDSDLDFSVYGAGKRKVRRTKKISINKITNKRQKRQSSHEDEDLNKKKTKTLLHRLSTEGIKIKTDKDLSLNKMKTIDTIPKVDKTDKPESSRNDRVVVKVQQKLPTTPLIPLGMGKSTSLLRKTFSASETTIQPIQGKLYKEDLPKPLPPNIILIKPQEKSTGGFTDLSKYLSKLGGEGEIINQNSSGSIIINRKVKEPTTSTHIQIQPNFVHHQKKYAAKESVIPVTQQTQISGQIVVSSHEDKELIDSLVNDELLQPMPNHGQMNIPNLVKMLQSTEQTILNQRSNEISTFQEQHQITPFSDTIANANVDDIPEDLLKDVAELIDNNTLEEFAEKQALQQSQSNNVIDFEATIPTNLLVGTQTQPTFVQHTPEQSTHVKYSSLSQVSGESINTPEIPHAVQTQPLIKPAVQVVQRNGRVITLPPIEAPNTRAKRKAATTTNTMGSINQIGRDQKLNTMKQTKSSSRRNSKEMASSKVSRLVGENRQKRVSTSSQKQSEKSLDHNELNPEEDDIEEDENDSDFNEDDDPDKLWCICRQPHNNRFMICCDVCEDWFHGTCVNVTKAMGLEMEQNGIDWTCPKCVKARKPAQRKITEMFEKKPEKILHVDPIVNKTTGVKKTIPQTTLVKAPIKVSSDGNANASLHIKSQTHKKVIEHGISKMTTKNPENVDKSEPRVQQQIIVVRKEPIKESTVKVQAPREVMMREQAITEQMMKEQQILREHTLKSQAMKAQMVNEQTMKVQPNKEQTVKEPTVKEPTVKEQTVKEQIVKEQMVKEQATKEHIAEEQGAKEQTGKELLTKEQTGKELLTKEQSGKELLTKERITKPKPGNQNIECIVCKKSAKPNSIYCSDDCIRKHAQSAISMKNEKGLGSDAVKKKSSFEEALGAAAVIVTPKKVERISVFERKTGRIITGNNAPTTITLKKWLQENPTFEVVQPGSVQQIAIDKKQRLQSQSSVESLNTPENTTKVIKVEHGVIKVENTNLTKLSKPFSLVSTPSTSKSHNFERKLPTKYSPNTTLKPEKIDKDKQSKQKLVSQKESKESKDVKQSQNTVRSNIVKNFREHLTARMNEITDNDHPKLSEAEIEKFANEIEEEMYYLYNKDTASTKYRIKYRSLQFNLKDRKNTTLFHKICAKMVGAKQLVRMSPEELASQELAAWRQQENKHQLEMIKNAELDLLACTKNYVLKTHKGEEVIESKTSDCISLDIAHIPVEDVVAILNNSVVSSTSELEQSTSSLKDSYKYHHESKTSSTKHSDKKRSNHSKNRDHREKHHKSKDRHKEKSKKRSRSRSRDRSNRHSNINQSGHKDDRVSKDDKKSHDKHRDKKSRDKSSDKSAPKVHISPAYSTSNSASSKSENIKSKPGESTNLIDQILESSTKSIEEAANLSSTKDTSFLKDENSQDHKKKSLSLTSPLDSDQEPTSTVQIATPPIYEDASDDPYSIYMKQLVWWTGSINMIDVATFQIHIQPISGEQIDLKKDLSTELDVVGRISPDTVWDYIAKIKMTSNKEILIVRLVPANETENIGYSALHMYLNNRKRLGVVKSETPTIKDFYLFPLGAKKPLPHLLKTNDKMDIFEEEARPDLLLGIIIRVKRVNYLPTSSKRSATSDIAIPNNKMIRKDPETVMISHKERLLRAEDHYTPPGSPGIKNSMPESHSLLNIGGKLPENLEESQNIDAVLHRSPVIMIQDDEPYSPGDSSEGTSHSIPGLSISKEDEELKRKMDEINRQIEVQEMEIAGMLGASNSSSDTYSPSNSLSRASLPNPSLANISIPSNLHQILASLKKPPPPPADDEEYNPEEPINSLMESKSSKTNKSSGSRLAQLTEEELLSMVPDDIDINIPKKDNSSFIIQPPPPGLEDDEEFS